mgnify:CR=1 FL=1
MKLGGSLLDLPDLAARLEDWLTNQPPMLNLCIAGGGEPVQEIKDRSGSVDSSNSHWECIRLIPTVCDFCHHTVMQLAHYGGELVGASKLIHDSP